MRVRYERVRVVTFYGLIASDCCSTAMDWPRNEYTKYTHTNTPVSSAAFHRSILPKEKKTLYTFLFDVYRILQNDLALWCWPFNDVLFFLPSICKTTFEKLWCQRFTRNRILLKHKTSHVFLLVHHFTRISTFNFTD